MDPLTGQPDDATTTAPPTPPIATENAAPSAATIPQQQPPAPPNVSAPDQQPAPQAPPARHGLAGILDAVGDILTGGGRGQPTVSIDANGNRTTAPGAPMTTGQKFAKVGLTALKGAARVEAAGTGPNNQARGVGNAIGGAINDQEKQTDDANQQAETDFQRQQQAKMQNLNYQILVRKMAADTITQAQQKVKANQEQIDFSNRQVDREKQLGSYELGFVADAGHIADLGNKDPNFIKNLHNGLIIPVQTYDTDGNTLGFDVYQRKPDANAQKFNGQIHMFTPGEKPTDPPKYTMFTPTDMTVGAATNADLKAAGQYNEWVKSQQDLKDKEATRLKTKAQTTEAYASANRSNAAAAKDRLESGEGPEGGALVDAIGTGHITVDRLGYLIAKSPALLSAVTKKYPGFDTGKAASYVTTYKEFTSTKPGTAGGALNAGGTALKHLKELNDMNTVKSHFFGTPAYNAYMNKADTVSSELAKFYGDATIPAIAAIKNTLTSTLPGNRHAAITTQAQSMGDKLDSYEQTWTNAAPSKAYEAPMPGIDQKAMDARAALDPHYRDRLVQQQQPQPPAQPQQQQQPQQPPPPAPQTHSFSPSAWKAHNPHGDVAAATEQAKQQKFTILQ